MRLILTLYKKWFDEILNGTKKIEYRELKPYYNRLLNYNYTELKFINGYGSKRPYIIIEIEKICINEGMYEIHLGKIKETGNL